MPFQKGKSGNPAGGTLRKGQQKDPSASLNVKINRYLEKNFDSIFSDGEGLGSAKGRETARIYCELLKYAVPRLSPKRTNVKFENLTEEQLDEIIEILQHNAPKSMLANIIGPS